MGDERVPTGPDAVVDAASERDRRALAELIRRTDRSEQVDAALAAGWRPPAPTLTTVDELDALPVGAVLTDRYGLIWIRGEEQWCEPRSTEVEVGELIEWAPLTVHVVVADSSASEDAQ